MTTVREEGVFRREVEAILASIEQERAAEVAQAISLEEAGNPEGFKNAAVARFFEIGQESTASAPRWMDALSKSARPKLHEVVAIIDPISRELRLGVFSSGECFYWDWRGWSYPSQKAAAELLAKHGIAPGALRLIHPFTIGATVQIHRVVDDVVQILAHVRPPGHTADHAGKIQVPGGMPKPGERLIDAAMRRTQEMTGLTAPQLGIEIDRMGHPIAAMWEMPHASSATVAFSATLRPGFEVEAPSDWHWVDEQALIRAGVRYRDKDDQPSINAAVGERCKLAQACGFNQGELHVATDLMETLCIHYRYRCNR